MASDNKTLGRFILDGIPPAPRGIPQIEVKFDIDADGILNVSAQDKATGREQHITITASSGLSKEEVDQMVRDAQASAADDRKRREQVEARNSADTLIYQAEKVLKDQGDKVPADVRSEVETAVGDLRTILDSGSAEDLRTKTQNLSESLQKVGASMYEEQAAPPPPDGDSGGEPGAPGDDEDVVEGEYREA
jgi:molecular chaperone DnaK